VSVRILEGDALTVLRTLSGRFRKAVHAYRAPQQHWERDWLVEQYVRNQRSASDIAATIGCTDANILFWLRKHGIPRRSVSQARVIKHWGASGESNPMHGKTGAANPRYVDGSSPERQRLYVRGEGRAFLRAILKRDGYCCVRCGAPKTIPKSLHVHHVIPWAGNPSLRFNEANALTLCRNCHAWVHSRKNVRREYVA
jgi:transposase-like protein